MSHVMRRPEFCICINKGAEQMHGNRAADQHLCFRNMDSASPLLLNKFESSGHHLWLYNLLCVGPGRGTPKTGFLTTQLILCFWYLLESPRPKILKAYDFMEKLSPNHYFS